MSRVRAILKRLLAIGWLVLLANEIRGAILAVPVLYAMAQADTWLALWVGFCSLAGIALSVIVPLWIWRKVT
jgi:hypothetical protein